MPVVHWHSTPVQMQKGGLKPPICVPWCRVKPTIQAAQGSPDNVSQACLHWLQRLARQLTRVLAVVDKVLFGALVIFIWTFGHRGLLSGCSEVETAVPSGIGAKWKNKGTSGHHLNVDSGVSIAGSCRGWFRDKIRQGSDLPRPLRCPAFLLTLTNQLGSRACAGSFRRPHKWRSA